MSTRVLIGTHELIFEQPDTIILSGHGLMDGVSATKIHAQMFAWVGKEPYMFLLCDMSDVTGFTADGRRGLVMSQSELPPRAVALCGAPFAIRVVFDLASRAWSLLGKQGRWMKNCPTKETSREWFSEIRPVVEAYARSQNAGSK